MTGVITGGKFEGLLLGALLGSFVGLVIGFNKGNILGSCCVKVLSKTIGGLVGM